MICPSCQTQNTNSAQICIVCGSKLKRTTIYAKISNKLPDSNPLTSDDRKLHSDKSACPTCQTLIDINPRIRYCPVCNSFLPEIISSIDEYNQYNQKNRDINNTDRFQPEVGVDKAASNKVMRSNYAEGTIIGDPIDLPDEYRDVDPIHALFVTILIIEILVVAGAILLQFVIAAIIIVAILALLRNSGLAFFLSGCLNSAFRIPFNIVSVIVQNLLGSIRPSSNPVNRRSVKEFQVDPTNGTLSAFVVKGSTSPRNLRKGDRVRIRTSRRNGRFYLKRGYIFEHDRWMPLRISEPPVGLYWFIVFLLINAVGMYIYLNYFGGRF